jgi:hypothetical protein
MFLIRVPHSSGMLEGHYSTETKFPTITEAIVLPLGRSTVSETGGNGNAVRMRSRDVDFSARQRLLQFLGE